ncbi:LLM class flavin-dependent oxidoreductase [Pelagibacterium mangrovi]|uniref:LLM class flavin-dependent oxidoreductase n=1 Tax=Pelagibacterium mangrovi TaxID=3119828 RepID=UPI002FC8C4FA
MTVRFGVSFDGFASTAEALEVGRASVDAGAHSLWMAEHLGYREAMVTSMGFRIESPAAQVVPTAISPYLWHPMPTAMSLATLAEVGSAPVGVAIGVGNPLFLAESGHKIVKPVRAVREFLDCLDLLWTGEKAEYRGEFFSLEGARLGFVPPRPLIIYVAAMGKQMLRLAGAKADGVVLSAGLSPQYCRHSLRTFSQGLHDAGRDPALARRASYLFLAVADDARTARAIVRPKLAFLMRNEKLAENIAQSGVSVNQQGIIEAISHRDMDRAAHHISDEAIAAFSIAGTPDECHEQLGAFIEAGINEPIFMIQGADRERELALAFLRDCAGRNWSDNA